jgi:cell division protease FtsH
MKSSSKAGCLAVGCWGGLVILFLVIWQFLGSDRPPATQVPYSEFRALMSAERDREPHVEAAVFYGREITFWVQDPTTRAKTRKMTIGPEKIDDLARELADHHIAVTFEKEDDTRLLPLTLCLGLFLTVAISAAFYVWLRLSHARKDLTGAMAEVERLKTLLAQTQRAQDASGDAT